MGRFRQPRDAALSQQVYELRRCLQAAHSVCQPAAPAPWYVLLGFGHVSAAHVACSAQAGFREEGINTADSASFKRACRKCAAVTRCSQALLQVRALLQERGIAAEHAGDGTSYADMEARDRQGLSAQQARASAHGSAEASIQGTAVLHLLMGTDSKGQRVCASLSARRRSWHACANKAGCTQQVPPPTLICLSM